MVYRELRSDALPKVGLVAFLKLLLGRRKLARVRGDSMFPTLANGDWVVYYPRPSPVSLVNKVIICSHPYDKTLIVKRLHSILETGDLVLRGDSPADSTDSRTFGSVPSSKFIGEVLCYWPVD